MGMSENGVYPQKNSHLVGIMISKTIGCRGTLFSGKPKWEITLDRRQSVKHGERLKIAHGLPAK